MNKFLKVVCSSVFALSAQIAFAHGEDKPGPNGGFIRMPGAFHTEVIPVSKNELKIYLLDIKWEKPSVKKSSLQIKYNDSTDAECKIQRNFYTCTFPKSVDLTQKGNLKVTAERDGQKGMEMQYPLPFKLEAAKDSKDDHSGHH